MAQKGPKKKNFVMSPPMLLLLLLLSASSWPPAESHVSLTFPPARKYQLDFLDTLRWVGLPGLPRGKA